jgi:hypothetical protein
MLVLALTLAGAAILDRRRGGRRPHGAPWWRALGAPLDARPVVRWALDGFWNVMQGAARLARPDSADLGRRYAELLGDNLRQPGYRELLIAAHDLETRRDLVFALLREEARPRFFGSGRDDQRSAEVVDLSGDGGRHVVDASSGALAVPGLTEPHQVRFETTGFWRGESHRVCDRPAAIVRLLEEVSAAGAEQVIVVTSDVAIDRPHALRARAVDPHGAVRPLLRRLPDPGDPQRRRPVRRRGLLRRAIGSPADAPRARRARRGGRAPAVHRSGRGRERRRDGAGGGSQTAPSYADAPSARRSVDCRAARVAGLTRASPDA